MDLKARARRLKADIPAVFWALKSPQTPWYAKALAAITVAYALSPIDLVPDFIPVLGYLDDVLLLPALIALTVKCVPKSVWEESRRHAQDLWQSDKPKKWFYALPILGIWGIVIFLIVRAFQ